MKAEGRLPCRGGANRSGTEELEKAIGKEMKKTKTKTKQQTNP